jgi:hypothetical protein
MRFPALCLAAVLSLGAGGLALADSAPSTTQGASTTTKTIPAADPNQTICKHIETTGTRIPGPKVCRTRQQWADLAAQARDGVDSAQSRGEYIPPMRGN